VSKKRLPLQPDSAPLTSLADLLRQRGVAVSQPTPATEPAPVPQAVTPAAEIDLSRSAKLVLRRERKGHGGKTATIIEGLALPAARLDLVARLLRKALGCGARADDGCVIVQGDLVDAIEAWLRRHGAARIVRGN
jgi:translation initiation factor 1 (eIF-1/SUI1)